MSKHFSVSTERTDDTATVFCSGELDIATAPDADKAVIDVISKDNVRLVKLDWSGLTFMDSTGIRLLLTTVRRCKEAGLELIWHLSPQAQRALDAVGIHDALLRSYGA